MLRSSLVTAKLSMGRSNESHNNDLCEIAGLANRNQENAVSLPVSKNN